MKQTIYGIEGVLQLNHSRSNTKFGARIPLSTKQVCGLLFRPTYPHLKTELGSYAGHQAAHLLGLVLLDASQRHS
jgi:hypothetical protein